MRVVLCTLLICGAGCLGSDDETVDVGVGDSKADSATKVELSASKTVTVNFKATGEPLDVSIDCGQSQDPDTVGMTFTVTAAALGQSSASDAVAGYWQWSGDVEAGQQTLKLRGKSGSASCDVRIQKVSGSCTSSSSFHSAVTGHTHVVVGTQVSTWGSFPVSGNHWGAWAAWNTVYDKPVQRGFLVHNLEHGGIVLSYNCTGPDSSNDCAQAASDLQALQQSFGESRVIVTPDPKQPTRYAARAWRWGLESDCYDEERMMTFMSDHFRQGREDAIDNPPIPYDPTTQNVPCHDLMAAPDSCN